MELLKELLQRGQGLLGQAISEPGQRHIILKLMGVPVFYDAYCTTGLA